MFLNSHQHRRMPKLVKGHSRSPGGAVDILSSLMRLGVRPSSSSAEGRLGRPCHPGQGISLGQRLGYPGLTKKKEDEIFLKKKL
jgi:hypothetical protein